MFVRSIMIEDITVVAPEDSLQQAYDLIQTKQYDCLPVMRGDGTLVGIIQLTDIYEACMQHGRQAALRFPVQNVMTTPVVTVSPDDLIEHAAKLLLQRDIPMLPVVEDGQLKGVVHESDIFKSFISLLGADSGTVRLTLVVPERKGQLARLGEIVRSAGLSIRNVATFHSRVMDQYQIVLRVETDAPKPLVELLERNGYKVIHVSID